MELPPEVQQARANASSLASTAGKLGAGGATIEDELRKAATEAYNSSQDIVGPLDTATQDYLGAPQVAREKYQNIFNPFTREKLVSQYIGNQALPMLSLSNIYGSRMGGIGDLIRGGVDAYSAKVGQAANEAALARQNYQDLLNEYQIGEDFRLREQAQPGSGGSNDVLDALLKSLLGGGGTGAGITEKRPTTNPGMSSAISPKGQWMWEWSPDNPNPEWIPIIE